MRIGIIGLLHESNTFVARPTTIAQFRENVLLTDADAIERHFAGAHHEIGGFFAGLREAGRDSKEPVECVPLFAARALPAGVIDAASWSELVQRLLESVRAGMRRAPLDGILVAPHGATVAAEHPDADGHWLSALRHETGEGVWIGGTLDLHANLSPAMTAACNFLTAYRSNPHLDQRDRGIEAATLMVRAVAGEIQPVMRAAFPPLAIAIDRQDTSAPWLREVYELAAALRDEPTAMLSTSLLLGFPYADVPEMGAAAVAVADGDAAAAQRAADQLADALLARREQYRSQLVDIPSALQQCESLPYPVCLLDMGDNVGGGSAADGTSLLAALLESPWKSFVCLCDPESVRAAEAAGVGARATLQMGGKTDQLHGSPVAAECQVVSLHDGKFSESQPRHGGMMSFDQGPTAVVVAGSVTIMLTTRRMVPFSLQQLVSCGLEPASFQILAAKGVHAPLAAYREVCPSLVRVNTPGSTSADMLSLTYRHRRRPLFPWEEVG